MCELGIDRRDFECGIPQCRLDGETTTTNETGVCSCWGDVLVVLRMKSAILIGSLAEDSRDIPKTSHRVEPAFQNGGLSWQRASQAVSLQQLISQLYRLWKCEGCILFPSQARPKLPFLWREVVTGVQSVRFTSPNLVGGQYHQDPT